MKPSARSFHGVLATHSIDNYGLSDFIGNCGLLNCDGLSNYDFFLDLTNGMLREFQHQPVALDRNCRGCGGVPVLAVAAGGDSLAQCCYQDNIFFFV